MPAQHSYSPEELITALYHGLLEREPDEAGFADCVDALGNGARLADLANSFVSSKEFCSKALVVPKRSEVKLPDLTALYPERYSRIGDGYAVFRARTDADFAWLENMIISHRYYDSGEAYSPVIDEDKRTTAALIMALGAKSCLELGCFTGPVLSVLADHGVDICGVDASHLAFVLAYPNVRQHLKFGDLLDQKFDRTFDVFAGMDILEHLDPSRIDDYIVKLKEIVNPNGFMLINSPMFGEDRIFGTVFTQYFDEWIEAGETDFWRHIHCDSKGWPVHGHLINASPKWWEAMFLRHGLVRDVEIERTIQDRLANFFVRAAARKSLFVLRRAEFLPDLQIINTNLDAMLAPLQA